MGIMNTEDYLNTVYYLNKDKDTEKAIAVGADASLWEDDTKVRLPEEDEDNYTLHGYYPRIKKINDKLVDINKELEGLK
jgi:hypothetical protein